MRNTHALTTLLAASVLSAGAVTTAGAVDGDTSITVGAPKNLVAGGKAPFDAPGVKAIRRGKAIPAGYVLPGRTVTVKAGTGAAGAAIRFTCPAGKALRTFATTGTVGLAIDRKYVGRRSTNVMSIGRGKDASGAVYAVCR
ncbi:MAG: hypothetical protein M3417_02180 [Actinomycetota bacterium]|nr:hypothetical protein [Actinomycetota bacterium]